jgi:protein-S-isoprenylcysteine O-methyltransferase Ste14
MEKTKDNAGVYLPPPFLYAALFFAAIFLEKARPLGRLFFETTTAKIICIVCCLVGLCFAFPALRLFLMSKNTVVTVKPANSLQTRGIYALSRNPMYLGLLFIYIGLSFFFGNWWSLLLLPVLVLIVQEYVIKREEKYLERRFGQAFQNYKKKVRRWL